MTEPISADGNNPSENDAELSEVMTADVREKGPAEAEPAETEPVEAQLAADTDSDVNEETADEVPAQSSDKQGVLSYYDQAIEQKRARSVKATIKRLAKRYFIDAFTGMAQGLFCTLIAGTILAQIASWCGDNNFAHVLTYIANIAKTLMGAGIGVGIAHKLGAKPLVIFSAAVTGLVGAFAGGLVSSLCDGAAFTLAFGAPGNPIGAYVVSLFTIEIAGLYVGKTKLDIVLVPLGMMALSLAGIFLAWPFIKLIDLFAQAIVLLIEAGTAVKVLTGVVVAIVMGILLTMPTSSAAIWVAIATSEIALANPEAFSIAGGAAVAGCAAHMIGFAFATIRENKFSGVISQGIGTSMLQIPNIMKKPVIMLPEIVASAVSGLVAVLMGLRCDATGGGMGTSGLVGVFRAVDVSKAAGLPDWRIAIGIVLCMFVIPAAVSIGVDAILRHFGKISPEDVKLAD